GFWFFAFPRKVVEEIGLPLPYFIKVDDMEFCIRITRRLGGKIVAFPSIGVWHEPFYNKVIIWDSYYYIRNNLITHSVYDTINYINTIFRFTKDLIFSLLIFEYNYAALIVRAFEDYLKGPSVIKSNTPEVLHKEILALTKSYKTQSIQSNYSPPKEVVQTKDRASFGKKLISLLTINGHLLPNFLDSEGEVFMWQTSEHSGVRSRAFRKKKVLIYREDNNCLFQNEFDKSVGIQLLVRWVKAVATSSFKWGATMAEWKAAYAEFTSTKFWQQYLGLKDKTNSKVEA
ncbi:MAG TPA: glycosyl transferase family 2, partial [Cyanobacteria bacterium UBA11049]|nr:glycosyl transferase family 2 [Cyanobacteria bacterium UBA11049]